MKKKMDEVIVSEQEIEEEVKKKKVSKKDIEPSWYHYLIVLVVFFGVLGGSYLVFEWFEDDEKPKGGSLVKIYNYEKKIGNVTYNIQLHSPISEIESLDYLIEVDKYDFFNSLDVEMVFDEYNGSDNGRVTVAASKLTSFVKRLYHFSFDEGDFKKVGNFSCSDLEEHSMALIFDPYSEENGVFEGENGCVYVRSTSGENMINVVDKFIYTLVNS